MMRLSRLPPRRVVLSYVVFDLFTPDHVDRLQALAQLGQELIIGCATDALCTQMGISPEMPFETRRDMLASCRYVDHVITQTDRDQQRTDIVNYNVSMLAMESKWQGAFDDLQDVAQVFYLPQTAQKSSLVTVDQHRLAVAH